ncbi:MAG: TIGR01459 family HAD-type hydrolase [Rhodobacteraceae bacterium]|nr:TIGR01459 family HAD-type hydrolase [Paracoccaceae bacterium]
MTKMIRSLAEVAAGYDAVFCDLWGCLHNGKAPFPAAVAALRAFRAGGGRVVLMTNAPRPFSAVERQLNTMGVPQDAWDLIVSSGDAAQAAMLQGAVGRKVFHIGAVKDEPFFSEFPGDMAALAASQPAIERVGMLDAEGIVCTGLADDQTETPADYRAQLLLGKTRGLPMLCANPDIVVDMGEKRAYCAGALAEDYANMGGEVLYYGKPHPPIYDLARRRMGLDDPRILCIGDGIATDVQGGIAEGLDTLFITGGIAADRFGPDPANPDPALLEEWLAVQRLSPTWAMPYLA